MNIIANRKIFYMFSGALFAASIVSFLVFGMKQGIDFTGGSLLEIEIVSSGAVSQSDIQKTLEKLDLGNILIQQTGERGFLIRFKHIDEETHQRILAELKKQSSGISEKRFDAIGPVIGKELKQKAVYSLVLVLTLIVLYIAWAFRRVSKPVSSWKYGVVAVIALFHDVIIPVGVFSVLSKFGYAEADTLFVTAVLTILGFSVHDTIVVFDRIRENLKNNPGLKTDFETIVEKSVKETIVRSINTSFTVLLSLLAVFFLGGESVKYFILVLILGVVFGTYSSIFIASPLLVTWNKWGLRKKTA